ncbi:MAG: LytTR family DNA-binding domain-containing protein [Peptacetobacter hiranonis]|nr:LytTR family DNA-binding domain-containing protein [Peptacetobacter hiranonis]
MEKYRIAICEDEEKERIQLKENLKKILAEDMKNKNVIENRVEIKNKIEVENIIIEELEEKLKDFKFFRCHKSYLVNLDKVDLIKTGEVVVNGKSVPVSKYRAKDLKREFTAILGDMIC